MKILFIMTLISALVIGLFAPQVQAQFRPVLPDEDHGFSTRPRSYAIEDVGTLAGPGSSVYSNATGLNELGEVACIAEDASGLSHAAIYSNGSLYELVSFIPNDSSGAKGINDLGMAVGSSTAPLIPPPGTVSRPAIWIDPNTIEDPALSISTYAYGWCWGINNHMQCAFTLLNAYFWDPVTGPRKIEFPDSPAGWGSDAWEINNHGLVVGAARRSDTLLHAFKYDSKADRITDLHDAAIFRHTTAYGVNDCGDVVGWGEQYDYYLHAMLWAHDGTVIKFPVGDLAPDLIYGQAEHINDRGDVVGSDDSVIYGKYNMGWVAFNCLNGGPVEKVSLHSLLTPSDQLEWELTHGFEINNKRQICGIGLHMGVTRGFLMTPMK